jgi:hypothetical protein
VQQSFIELGVIDKFLAVGERNRSALRPLTQNGIDSQGQKKRRHGRAGQKEFFQSRFQNELPILELA